MNATRAQLLSALVASVAMFACTEKIELAAADGPVDAPSADAGFDAASDGKSDAASDGKPDAAPVGAVDLIADDPFGDGTAFAFVTGFAGQVYLGPAADGTGAVRFAADGSSPEIVPFAFQADTTGNRSRNTSTPPHSSIGRSGCAANTADCGPDNEDGRGLFASAVIDGAEYLLVGGARSEGDLNYVYMAPTASSPLDFRYVDLSAEQGPQTRGHSAMHVFANRLYLGFPDNGGARPYMHALINLPMAPGLDGVNNTDFVNLEADDIPGLQTEVSSMIDSFTDFGDRLYLANSGAWIRSNNRTPGNAESHAADWETITPSAPAFTAKVSVSTTKTADIEPADKAVPQIAVFAGRVYAARNTTDGPQLWRCDPATTAPAGHCDSGDWTLTAANSSGDRQLSQLNDADNTAISMLVATATHLYIGFDNATDGIAVVRATGAPTTASDFTVVSSAGLGDPSNIRLFDAKAIDVGGETSVYLVCGSGAHGVRVFRLR